MLTVLGPYAATGVEYRAVVWRDGSTAREFTGESVCVATPGWRGDDLVFAASALDYGYRCGERNERYCGKPQELLRSEMRAHQWNI
jgi:hypothetical protein